MSIVTDVLVWACLLGGSFFSLVGGLGLIRMPDLYTRMHAASVTDTLGAGLILLGLAIHSGLNLVSAKLLMVALMIFFTSPVATHALAKAGFARRLKPLLADEEDASSKP